MIQLGKWLLEQVAVHEEAARSAAAANPPPWTLHVWQGKPTGLVLSNKDDHLDGALWDNEGAESLSMEPETAAHIVRWDPARVLADIDTKRHLIELHGSYDHRCPHDARYREYSERSPCMTLRLLALAYSDQPGYAEALKA